MDERTGDYLVRRAELGYRSSVLTQAMCGGTSPATMAGTVVAGVADILAGWAAVHALNPEMELLGATLTGAVDMRSGNMSICCPESLLQDAAICEVFRRLYGGGGLHVALSGEYTDARVPGLHAAYEKAVKAILISEYIGTPPYVGNGLIENGKTFSREQALLGLEMGEFLRRYYHGFEVNDETIALDDIIEVGFGRGTNFMATEHTLRHFREVWYPRYLDRSMGEDGPRERAKERAVMEKVCAEAREIQQRYVAPEVDPDKLAALQAVIDKAAEKAGL
jgi:trimethylamine--corrinoid protein Co-methyltransferase